MTEHADRADGCRIVNANDLDWTGTDENGGGWKRLAEEAGGTRLGCTFEEIPPGGRPARYHYHTANEEALFVFEGCGTLRTPAGEYNIESGDYVSFPVGEAGAHAVENTSNESLRCLFFSTMNEPDIVVYPDDGKLHVVAGATSGLPREKFTLETNSVFDANDSGGEWRPERYDRRSKRSVTQYSQSRSIRPSISGWSSFSVSTLVSPFTLMTWTSPRRPEYTS